MRYAAWFFALILALGSAVPARARVAARSLPETLPPLRVLFVGNSYTQFHALPLVVRRVVQSIQPEGSIQVESVTHPGWDLGRHWTFGEARRRIEEGHFTHVVLQGHSLAAIRDPAALRASVGQFQTVIAESGAHTVLYETWARAEGSDVYEDGLAVGPTEMQEQIDRTYHEVARSIGGTVARVGPVFLHVESLMPGEQLYQPDHSHPTELGTYIAGCVIASALTSVDVREISYRPRRVTRGRARSLRQAVAEVLVGATPAATSPSVGSPLAAAPRGGLVADRSEAQ